jgi:hypothetical protein
VNHKLKQLIHTQDKEIMSVEDKIVQKTVETIIDSINEQLITNMFEFSGSYYESKETNDEFFERKKEMTKLVIKELYNRIKL